MFGTVCPARKLRLDALVRGCPDGRTEMKPARVGWVAVAPRSRAAEPPGRPPRIG